MQGLIETTYLHMIPLERDQERLKTFRVFLQESVQEILSIYQSLNNMRQQVNLCLNNLTKADICPEHSHEPIIQQARNGRVKRGVIHISFPFQ